MTTQRQFCTFHLDQLFCGVEVQRVQEIVRSQTITRVPLASRMVRGLINLRGQIVTAIDLRRRLGLGDRPAGKGALNVVVRTEEGLLSLLVDKIGDVLAIDENAFERLPETMRESTRELLRGVYKFEDRLLLILDLDRVVNFAAE
jgi:purine-binding chemotaxis protein CheW